MADTAGPSSLKKRKIDVNKDLFVDFLSNTDQCARVSRALDDLFNGSGPIPLVACSMEILEADANLCRSFGNVYCHTRCHFDETPITISIGTLFKRGCSILHEYLKNRKVPGEEKLRNVLMVLVDFLAKEDRGVHIFIRMLLAIQFLPAAHIPRSVSYLAEKATTETTRVLVTYITRQWLNNTTFRVGDWSVYRQTIRTNNDVEEQSSLFEDATAENEVDWCLRVAQHLFSQLSYVREYTIDNGYEGSSDRKNCPCSTKDDLVGKFGDTSFGCKTLWHGSADLIFGMETPAKVVKETADMSDSESESSDDTKASNTSQIGMEAKNTEHDFSLKDKYQMRGQVVGFGFYINKLERQNENPKYFLTPLIGFSKKKIKFLFYDSVHDVLLETSAHELCYYGNQLSYHIILTLWFVMNYKMLGGETPEDLRKYKSGLHSMFPSKVKCYKIDIEAPCHVKSSLQKEDSLPNYCKYFTPDVIEVCKDLKFKSVDDL